MNRLRNIFLKKSANYSSHPWIYRNHIASDDPRINAGDIIRVLAHDKTCLGIGYYNPASIIAVRMLSREEISIDKNFFTTRITKALVKRSRIKEISNAYRMLFSEADDLPGIVADLYDDTLVFQLTTLGMDRCRPMIVGALNKVVNPKFIYEKSDVDSRRAEDLSPVAEWHGSKGRAKIRIYEGKADFIIDIIHGHKTGFYLDQRKSRIAAGNFARCRRVLDVFCYSGGFSIHTALGNAEEVTGLDIKDKWLILAKENADINNLSNKISSIKGDAFDILKGYIASKRYFDMVILDPPSFAKNKSGIKKAAKGYLELNRYAMRLLSEKGILCTFSCSYHINNNIFSGIIKKAAVLENKEISILKRCRQDRDHPIVKEIPETEYLKGYFISVSSK